MDEDKRFLSAWILTRLGQLRRERPTTRRGPSSVTVLAYHFWEASRIDPAFDAIECALRETWFHCGMMKTVVVLNHPTPHIERFAESASPWVSLVQESSLIPGKIFSMSEDCNSRLHTRFDTPSVLIVQNDGFPLRDGLLPFVGKYDFIGAPYIRDIWWKRSIATLLGCWVSNGGFSLRSHEICEKAAFYWKTKYRTLSDCHAASEDIFYTQTLPLHERAYRRSVKIADCREAIRFSYDAITPYTREVLPFGFHGAKALARLSGQFPGLIPKAR